MKIATYNIQNIFHRDVNLVKRFIDENKELWTEEFENLLIKGIRCDRDYSRMRILSNFLGFEKTQDEPLLTMKHKMGHLHIKKTTDSTQYKATYLTNWNGWIKLNSKPINDTAIKHKAKVINEVDPDILILQEVEDRASLIEFNKYFLLDQNKVKYRHIIYLETNDVFGRGIGILTKEGYRISSIKTHVNDLDSNGTPLFDMDLQEYEIKTFSGESVNILSAYLTDDLSGVEESNMKRKVQSQKIAEVYRNLQTSKNLAALMGTLNAPSYSDSISPLIKETDLKDITKHKSFEVDLDKGRGSNYFRMGAYKMGVNIRQKDYFMLCTKLFKAVKKSGLCRKGVWFKKQPQWDMLKTIKNENHAASEHPLVWAGF